MLNKFCVLVVLFILILFPTIIFAQSQPSETLVPCGLSGNLSDQCQFCHLIELIQRVINFIIAYLAAPVATLLIAYAGVKLIIHGDDTEARSEAKQLMKDIVIGFLWIVLAWTLVLGVLKILVKDVPQGSGSSWFRIQCFNYAAATFDFSNFQGGGLQAVPVSSASTYIADRGSTGANAMSASSINAGISNTSRYRNTIISELRQSGVPESQIEQRANQIQALMAIESSGNPNAVSSRGAVGLLQVMPATARGLDPTVLNMEERLLDPNYNIRIGTRYFLQGLQATNNNLDLTAARYNGGPGALRPSRDCPGLLAYQCQWDSSGCFNTGQTNCLQNRGYQQTRNYVANFNSALNAVSR